MDKTYSGDDFEMTNIFNMPDHLLTNINYTAIQTQKPEGQWNLFRSAGQQVYP